MITIEEYQKAYQQVNDSLEIMHKFMQQWDDGSMGHRIDKFIKIPDLPISMRTYNVLQRIIEEGVWDGKFPASHRRVQYFEEITLDELRRQRNYGKKTEAELIDLLKFYDINLAKS